MWWRSWYYCDGWEEEEEECAHHIQHRSQGEISSSGVGFEKDTGVAGQIVNQTAKAAEEQYRINVLLRELGALTAGSSDADSTQLGSAVSGSVFDDIAEDNSSTSETTCDYIVDTISKKVSVCMGRGRGPEVQDQNDIVADSCGAKAGRVRSPIVCGRGRDVPASVSSVNTRGVPKMIAKSIRRGLEAALETRLKTMLHNYTRLKGIDDNG